MIKYKLIEDGVLDTDTGAMIPNYPGNREWRTFQKWVNEGNTPDPQYTTEELAEKVLQDNIIDIKSTIRQSDRVLFRMIIALYSRGNAIGLWVPADFPYDLRSKVTEIKQYLDALENLGVD